MRERWQKFLEDAETYFLDVIFQQRPGKKASVLRGTLQALSHVFAGAVKLRRVLYNARIFRDATLYSFGEGTNEIQRELIARELGL